jgi:hypothetical protein
VPAGFCPHRSRGTRPPDPAILVTAVPTWSVCDVITVGPCEQLRVVAIDDFPHAEPIEQGIGAIFIVEPV